MKIKTIIYSIFISLAFIACNDDLSSVGLEIQPDSDKISVRTDTVSFTSSTQLVDSIFIKSSMAYLGSFNDPVYGNVRYGYLCNFYTSPDGVFWDNVVDNKIDSVVLSLLYKGYAGTGFIGDSLAVMEATIHKVMNPLGKNFYSNINPAEYIKDAPILAKKTYTSRNMNVSDSIYFLDQYYRSLDIKFSNNDLGEEIYNEWRTNKETFKNLDKFFDFFRGVYVESTFGSGNILKIDHTHLQVYYRASITYKNKEGKDSIVVKPAYALFSTAAESTQLNIIDKNENEEKNKEMVSDPNYTYLKTPAGVVTQLEISLQDIVNKIGDDKRIFNNVRLTLETAEQPAWEYTLNMPNRVMLISPDSVKQFFEEARYSANSNYYYFATRTPSSAYKYDFGNISVLIQNSIKDLRDKGEKQENWPPLKLWVIPVEFLPASGTPYATTNYFAPSGAKLKKENLKLYITTTKSNK